MNARAGVRRMGRHHGAAHPADAGQADGLGDHGGPAPDRCGKRDGSATAAAPRPTSKREAEKALRDAGLSHTAAKAVLAGGWEDEHEDVDARDVRALTELSNVIKGANEGMA